MSSFLTNHGVVVALVCAACAVVYGLVTTRSLLALPPGNERMQSISLAVQQGARAYLNRQYTTIALVGAVVFVALIFVQNIAVASGFLIGGILSGSAGYVGMNVSVRANATPQNIAIASHHAKKSACPSVPGGRTMVDLPA